MVEPEEFAGRLGKNIISGTGVAMEYKPRFNPVTATEITDEQVADLFVYHPWTDEQVKQGNVVRRALGEAARAIIENVPPSPDRTVALRKIREARMDANSAITHNGKY